MRKVPFSSAEIAGNSVQVIDLTETLKGGDGLANFMRNREKEAGEILTKEVKPETTVQQPAAEEKQQQPPAPPEVEQLPSEDEENTKSFEDFRNGVADKLGNGSIEDPEEMANLLINLANVGRSFAMPWLYNKFMFHPYEEEQLQPTLLQSFKNEENNLEPTANFTRLQIRIYNKYQKLQEANENVAYTEPEVKFLAKIVAKRITDVGLFVWLEKYDWILAIVWLEAKHAKNIINARLNDKMLSIIQKN